MTCKLASFRQASRYQGVIIFSKWVVFAMLAFCTTVLAAESGKGPVVFDKIGVFPVGWDSEQQIAKARDSFPADHLGSYRIDNNDVIFFAPFSGKFAESGEGYELENNLVRVTYPNFGDALLLKSGEVVKGEPFLKYQNVGGLAFVFVWRNSKSSLSHTDFENGELNVHADRTISVYSISSGYLTLLPKIFEEDEGFPISIIGDTYETIYLGISKPLVGVGENLSPGTGIGSSSKTSRGNWVNIKLFDNNASQIVPRLIYLESKSRQKTDK